MHDPRAAGRPARYAGEGPWRIGAAKAFHLENHFELFGLAPRYALDEAALDRAWREIQSQVHPDRHVAASDAERRASMQRTTQVNEAYRVLKDPLERAAYLLSLRGIDPKFETDTGMPREFLMRQMEFREALDEASKAADEAGLERLHARLAVETLAVRTSLATLIDGESEPGAAVSAVRELMFLQKLARDVERAFEALEA